MSDPRSVALRIADMKLNIEYIEKFVRQNDTRLVILHCQWVEDEARELKQLYKHTTLF